MIYSIIRLLKDGNTCTQILDKEKLDDELQCWQFDSFKTYSNLSIFFMFDENSSGHIDKSYDFVNNICKDKLLMQKIKDFHGSKNNNMYEYCGILEYIYNNHNVPFVLLPHIFHEIKCF